MKNYIGCIAVSICMLCLMSATPASARPLKVVVNNTSDIDRKTEMISLNAAQVKRQVGNHFVVTLKGAEQPYQLTYDGKLIFRVSLAAHSKAIYLIKKGSPRNYEVEVYGRLHSERLDDMAWENDRMAYRSYGPALQRSGEKGFGNDVWLKRTPKLVCDFRYGQEERAIPVAKALREQGKAAEAKHLMDSISYHIDHGTGMDNYDVGPTLGCGATAFLQNNRLVYPWCFSQYQVLDNGPLRFTVRLSYPVEFNGQKMTEVRLISLDAGSQLNKVTVSYIGQQSTLPVAAGVVMHKGSDDCNYSAAQGYAGYAERVKGSDEQTYVGLVFPNRTIQIKVLPLAGDEKAAAASGATGHLIGVAQVPKAGKLTYYWGAGWSKYGFAAPQDWYVYLKDYAQRLRQPLRVSVSTVR